MKQKNYTKAIIISVIAVLLIPLAPMLIFFITVVTQPSPPLPEIRRGEFEFRLEYEIDGQRHVVEDTIIVEFDGINHFSTNGKYRRWSLHLQSDRRASNLLLLQLEDGRRVYYNLGSPNYYMGDFRGVREPGRWYPFNGVFYVERGRNSSTATTRGVGGVEGLYDEFGITLISWEVDPPIVNRFIE